MNHKEKIFAYMDSLNNHELPDGAWQAQLEEAVVSYNDAMGTNFDPYDTFIDYCLSKE